MLNPPILILDEATSMFDPAGEHAFIAECGALLAGKTVLLITHRPASLALAERTIYLPGPGEKPQPEPTQNPSGTLQSPKG